MKSLNPFWANLLSEQSTATATSTTLAVVLTLIAFFFLIRREFRYDIGTREELITKNMALIQSELKQINQALSNHITDTNKRIDILSEHIRDTNKRIDTLSERIDKQSDQFNKLYEFLLKENKKV